MEKSSEFFNANSGYDKEVYENTPQNWVKIFVMLGLFYVFNGFHWAFNFELGVHDSALLTKYNLFFVCYQHFCYCCDAFRWRSCKQKEIDS